MKTQRAAGEGAAAGMDLSKAWYNFQVQDPISTFQV